MNSLKELFLLDPSVVFLNHGSFGATPRPVFEVYQDWQRQLEKQPVRFLAHEFPVYDRQARRILGEYLGSPEDDIAFITNATYGVNLVARSLKLGPGDEVLSTDHEYGACDKVWEFLSQKSGFVYTRQHLPLPAGSTEETVGRFWEGVNARTRLIFLSHITSATAQLLPVEEICRLARQAGIKTLVDGAHAPGQIPVNLLDLGADFYTGNLHKWALAPKGAAFLYVRHEAQPTIEPLVVSWGWNAGPETSTGSPFIDMMQWQGTKDPSAALAVPAAIEFQRQYNWQQVREDCNVLLSQALDRISGITGLPGVYSQGSEAYTQMAVVPLPENTDIVKLKDRLYDEYHLEIPCLDWKGRPLLRVSVQGYNDQADIDCLINALRVLIP